MSREIVSKGLSAVKNSFFYRVSAQIVSILVTVALVRGLSKQDYGVYNLLLSFIGFMSTVASFGIANTLQRYIPEYYEKREFKIANRLYRQASLIRLFSNIILLGLVLIFWDQIAPLLKLTAYKNYFMLFSLILLLYMQRGILEICLSAYFLQKQIQKIGLGFQFATFTGYSISILIGMNLWHVLIVDLTAYCILFLGLQIVYQKRIPITAGELGNMSAKEKKRVTRYALFYNFNDAGIGLLNPKFDNFLIAYFMTAADVGIYAFYHRIAKLIGKFMPIKYFIDIVRPVFFSAGAGMDSREINKSFQFLVKISCTFRIPVFFFIVVLGESFIYTIFGENYSGYTTILAVIFFFRVLEGFDIPISLVAQLKEKANVIFYSKIFAAYNLIAGVILIRYFGILGAVIATESALLGKNLFIWYFNRKDANFWGMQIFFTKSFCFWAIVAACAYTVAHFFEGHLLRLFFGGSIFFLSMFLQFRLKPFNYEEERMFKELAEDKKNFKYVCKILDIS